jgi:C-terminal processing protease CtpA/Prc
LNTVVLAHLIDRPIQSPRWHVPEVKKPDRQGMTFLESRWPVAPQKPRFRAGVAFVTDGRAVSYAETYLGMVEHYHLGALVVGEATAGTNGNVNPFSVPGGYRILWTGMKVRKHDGSRHHGVGIQPTVGVNRTVQGIREGRDELLEKAIREFSGP